MCSGRLWISGSVVYWSRTKPWNALPPSRSRRKPSNAGARFDGLQVLRAAQFDAGSGALRPGGREGRVAIASAAVGNLGRGDLDALRLRVRIQKRDGQETAIALQVVTREVQGLALDEFFIESVAISPVLSPVS